MFKKRRAARALKKNKDIIALVDWQKERSKELDEKFAAAEGIKDPAEKILKLAELASAAWSARLNASYKQNGIINRRINKKLRLTGSAGGLAGAAAVAVPGALSFPPLLPLAATAGVLGVLTGVLSTEGRITRKNEKRLEKNPDVKGFADTMTAQEERAQKMLYETAASCDLDEVTRSPRFKEAFDVCETLSGRFARAASAEAIREYKVKTGAQPVKRPPPSNTPGV